MRGDPWGAETHVTKVTSTASVPWKRKEAGSRLDDNLNSFQTELQLFAIRFGDSKMFQTMGGAL